MPNAEKKYRSQQEKFFFFCERMAQIKWEPAHAAFQLSPDKRYGRHGVWYTILSDRRKHIANAVWDKYGLALGIDDGTYAYFLPSWERTHLVEFIGDIEQQETHGKK